MTSGVSILYFTCPEATISLLYLEREHLPLVIFDPCAGDGAIIKLLDKHGFTTFANDIKDYGLTGCVIGDYLTAPPLSGIAGIITNPPYKKAIPFLEKALTEVGYVAFLLRSNFLIEAAGRDAFLAEHPPARVYYSSQRLPMMHRFGWTGRTAPSNTPYAWGIWDRRADHVEVPVRFRWRDIWKAYQAAGERLDLMVV